MVGVEKFHVFAKAQSERGSVAYRAGRAVLIFLFINCIMGKPVIDFLFSVCVCAIEF